MQEVLYLHGFASSSRSEKALLTQAFFKQHPSIRLRALDLPYTPDEAMAALEHALDAPPHAIIGSSLGGFLATVLAERLGCRACLINPAVAPHKVLANYVGEYHHPVLQQRYQVQPAHMQQLEHLMPTQLRDPSRYLVLLQTGDEVLDYRQAVQYYHGAQIQVIPGGDHSFVGFEHYLPQIAEFCLHT
ncbi:YqiA/YcfP family alpha/beta fold hydrolase [Alishewanella tabrizica]|uniref:Esterase n=1 Tax=Alishewanella tabrizica TaxID=671278 RepID=A0ABQ2WJ49_9ALTE|nr:YqiA/YcfP family alpha/beta fold hydrolase [Alishewanella tabrizica]GGW56318.1 esterase [Alishewanella tabrizica]